MKIQVTHEEATKAIAAGMTVECYLVVAEAQVHSPDEKKRTRSFITKDTSQYHVHGAPPKYSPGSDMRKTIDVVLHLFKNNQKIRKRHEITGQLTKKYGWNKQKAISIIARIREDGYLVLVDS